MIRKVSNAESWLVQHKGRKKDDYKDCKEGFQDERSKERSTIQSLFCGFLSYQSSLSFSVGCFMNLSLSWRNIAQSYFVKLILQVRRRRVHMFRFWLQFTFIKLNSSVQKISSFSNGVSSVVTYDRVSVTHSAIIPSMRWTYLIIC